MEEQKEKEKGVGWVQCAQPTPFGAEREALSLELSQTIKSHQSIVI